MPKTETLLFTIDQENNCRIGAPPADPNDDYNKRAKILGKLEYNNHVFFNPKGEMFVVRGDQLFKGPTPIAPWDDWFSLAKCVGRGSWDQFKFLYFHPNGNLFAVHKPSAWYKGPEPDNENVSWIYKQAMKIGGRRWDDFDALFFDHGDLMYGVFNGTFRRNPPLCTKDGRWLDNSIMVGERGWDNMHHFMGFSSDGKLWCVSRDKGIMYAGDPPTHKHYPWIVKARNVGTGYNKYKKLAFLEDITIMKILSVNFLADIGNIVCMVPELVTEKVYDNKDSTTLLKSTFEVDKVYVAESEFTHEHGMEFGHSAETTIESGIPLVGKSNIRMSEKATMSQNWNFAEKNRIETHFKMISNFEVAPGKAIRQTAVVKKAMVNVPYTAEVLTVFGSKITIAGTWKGCSFFDLKIRQVDEK